ELDHVRVSGRVVPAVRCRVALHRARITAPLECTEMRIRWPLLLVSFAVCAALTALAAWILDWSFQRAATLSPVIVLVVGAAAFLAGEMPGHDPFLLGDMREACAGIRAAIAAGKRICVHGDYDVDGICATALAALTLRELGADVDWHLPSRFEEGYGVAGETLSRLAAEGFGLVLTVDC